MAFYVVILFAAAIVFWLIKQRGDNLRREWTFAATRLNLNYSPGGWASPHWIYGKKSGMRFDVKTFSRRTEDGSAGKWTGYRVQFPKEMPANRLSEVLRKRLTQHFQECEIGNDQVFCAKPYIETEASVIVDNVNRILSVINRMIADSAAPDDRNSGPPPVPPRKRESAVEAVEPTEVLVGVSAEEEEEPDGQPETEAEPESAQIVDGNLPESDLYPQAEEKFEPASVSQPPAAAEAKDAAPKVEAAPEAASQIDLAAASKDLFDQGRNRYEISRHFDTEYEGVTLIGEGKVLRIDSYSNDRHFGRGPGALAEIEVFHPEEPLPGLRTIRAVVQLPEVESLRELRGMTGDTVTISGTLIRCDAFEGKIFLGSGEMA